MLGFRQRAKAVWNGLIGRSAAWTDMLGGETGGEVRMSQPFKQSVWVMNAVEKIAAPISSVGVELSEDPDFETALEKTPAMKRWMRRPAVGLTWNDFTYATVGWLKCAGEAFWLLDDAWLVPHLDVVEDLPPMIMARPDRMRQVIVDGKLKGWVFIDGAGKVFDLPTEQVIHLKQWNPYDEWRGLGNMEVARDAAETEWLAARMVRAIMRDNGDRGAIVVAKQGITDGPQRDQIVATLREANRKRRNGQPAPLFLTNDVTIEDPKLFTPDASFWEGRRETRKEIFAAFNIPLSMADTQASYSIGSASDNFRLLQDVCIPTAEKIADGLDQVFSRLQGGLAYSSFNFDEHSTMQAVRDERLEAMDKLWNKGMPARECSNYLNLNLPRYKGDGTGYLPFSVSPVGSNAFGDPADDPDFGEEPTSTDEETVELLETDSAKAMMKALNSPIQRDAEEEAEDFQDKREQSEIADWRRHERRQQPIRKAYRNKFTKSLFAARKQVLEQIAKKDVSKTSTPIGKASATDFLFNLADFKSALLRSFSSVSADALKSAGQSVYDELSISSAWITPAPFVQDFLRSRSNMLAGVADGVFADIKESLSAGIDAGDSMSQLAGRVKGAFKGVSDERALTIAQTETGVAYARGREKAMAETGVKKKKWLTSGNGNVRPAHAKANGQVRNIDQPFDVGGEQLMHPGDSAHGAGLGNVINCHCISIPIVD